MRLLSTDRSSRTPTALSRPDSSMSVSSVATTSCSVSVSETDSGIDFGGKSNFSRPTSVYSLNNDSPTASARGFLFLFCLSICLFVCLFVCLFAFCLFVCLRVSFVLLVACFFGNFVFLNR